MIAGFIANSSISPAKMKPSAWASSLIFLLFTQAAEAGLTFSFNYLDPGQGFDDPALGSQRKAALNDAASLVSSYFTDYDANLTYNVRSSNSTGSTLASSGSYSYLVPGSYQPTFVQTKILSNGLSDVNGAEADGNISWNFSEKLSLTDTVAANQFDFKQVAVHELLHTFGFDSNIREGGKGLAGNAPGTADTWANFDNFLTDAAGNRLISPDGVFDVSKVAELTGGSSVFFNGANAKDANGGAGIPIFSPTTWKPGSSLTHLDDDSLTTTQLLMSPSVSPGLGSRALSPLEIGILKDLGYANVAANSAVPLPAGIWLLFSGLIVLFGVNRQRKATPTFVH
jgi:hypothetical protein